MNIKCFQWKYLLMPVIYTSLRRIITLAREAILTVVFVSLVIWGPWGVNSLILEYIPFLVKSGVRKSRGRHRLKSSPFVSSLLKFSLIKLSGYLQSANILRRTKWRIPSTWRKNSKDFPETICPSMQGRDVIITVC